MKRSDCPISNALDHLGDRWSLLIIRDIAFYGKRTYGALLESSEGIATNVLSKRLSSLEASHILQKQPDPGDGRRHIYSLTEAGKDLIPILIDMITWSAKHSTSSLDIPFDLVAKAETDRNALLTEIRQQIDNTQG